MTRVAAVGWFWFCVSSAPLWVACGGRVSTGSASSGTGGAALGGSAGSAAAAGAGSSCVVDGKTYEDGSRFPAADGCNTCSCDAGTVSCTEIGCDPGCQFGGQFYQVGQSFKDDCNTCTCQADGRASCTKIACGNQCDALEAQYEAVLARARACDPKQQPNQCTDKLAGSLGCGCAVPSNSANQEAIAELKDLWLRVPAECVQQCPCIEAAGVVVCSDAGRCEYAAVYPGHAACKVEGNLYAHGMGGIKKPGSCNTCVCLDGVLSNCTTNSCPEGQSDCGLGTGLVRRCIQCGIDGGCEIAETACLQRCTGTGTSACASGYCQNGFCGGGSCDDIPK